MQVLINGNSFALGAKLVDPSITTSVIFTGDWTMPVKEAEATNSLIGQGIAILGLVKRGAANGLGVPAGVANGRGPAELN